MASDAKDRARRAAEAWAGARVLVCGGRGYHDTETITATLDPMAPSVLIHGGASGADHLAGAWAAARGVPCMVFPAPWVLGPQAGPMRNAWMLTYGLPDVIVAFPGGRGTEDMVRKAKAAGIPVVRALAREHAEGGGESSK